MLFLFIAFTAGGFAREASAMPPHPELLRKYREGKIAIPEFLKNPELLKSRGINVPPKKISALEHLFSEKRLSGPEGDFKALALLVDFSDNLSQVGAAYFDTLVFGTGTGTVRDFYTQVSYGSLTIVTVNLPSAVGWSRASQPYAYYTDGEYGLGTYPQNAQRLVEEVVDAANAVVDYSQYDNDGNGVVDALFVIHAGSGAELTGSTSDIWSHQWAISPRYKDGVYIYPYSMEPEYWYTPGDMTIGVYCHELGHVFGLPDLYDTDYSSQGIGRWSLMAGGSWNGTLGNSPAHPDAWSRIGLGFADATIVTQDFDGASIAAIENAGGDIYLLWDCGLFNDEFFLVENRQKIGYDAALPGAGLLIWHIDQAKTNNTRECLSQENCDCINHFLVALEQADGQLHLEKGLNSGDAGDCFPGSTNKRSFDLSTNPNSGSYIDCDSEVAVSNISNSATTMTADFAVCSTSGLTQITLTSPANGAGFSAPPTFEWSADGGSNNAFAVDASLSPTFSSYYSTYDDLGLRIYGTSWTVPLGVWNKIPAGSPVYWRVRGADLSIKPLDVVTSDQVWSFYKQ